jgi:hypothetical protein
MMREFIWPLLIGIGFGMIDVIPMIKNKLNRFSVASAFVFHLIMPVILANLNLALWWWLKGGIVYAVCALPLVLLIAKDDKKSVPIVLVSSFVIGILVGIVLHVI